LLLAGRVAAAHVGHIDAGSGNILTVLGEKQFRVRKGYVGKKYIRQTKILEPSDIHHNG